MAKNELENENILNDIMNMYLLTIKSLKVPMLARAIANQKIVWHT